MKVWHLSIQREMNLHLINACMKNTHSTVFCVPIQIFSYQQDGYHRSKTLKTFAAKYCNFSVMSPENKPNSRNVCM